ncbi:MAG: endonuclease/exonuclease/phosphatase family protein [Thermoleophilia bacterium]|nr:endonuclease/exonuclease/phosphatase family protein [Thermoleophilia bacterium]
MPWYRHLDAATADGARTIERLEALRAKLDAVGPPPRNLDSTLVLATWNIREFDSPKYGSRLPEALQYMAEIIDRFDILAIQEVHQNREALDELRRLLGPYWDYLLTDVTIGARGNNERMAFLYDSRKLRLGGLAGEVVLPPIKNQPVEQPYRTPYLVEFKAGWTRFVLASVHAQWGAGKKDDPQRVAEIDAVAGFLEKRIIGPDAWSRNVILLGDFNIFDDSDPGLAALARHGFVVPEAIRNLGGTNITRDRIYDQIAFHRDSDRLDTTGRGGVIDFFDTVFLDDDEATYVPQMGNAYATTASGSARRDSRRFYRDWRTHQMSDHYPLWVELTIDYSGEYLKRKQRGEA